MERSSSSRQNWSQRVLPTAITISKATTPAVTQDAVAHKHGVQIGYKAAKKAKKLAHGDDLQSQAAQFAKLPNYADVIRIADPEAIAILTTEEHDSIRRFHRFFVCPGVSRTAFEHCRFFLPTDGTVPTQKSW